MQKKANKRNSQRISDEDEILAPLTQQVPEEIEDDMEETTSKNTKMLPKKLKLISPSTLKHIIKQEEVKLNRPPKNPEDRGKALKSAAEKKKKDSPAVKNFDHTPRTEEEISRYNSQIQLLGKICLTLAEQSPMLVGNYIFFRDSFNGLAIPHLAFSIPHYSVGVPNRNHSTPPPPSNASNFYGAFIDIPSMLSFMKEIVGVLPEDIMYKNVAQYYGINSKIDKLWESNNELARLESCRMIDGNKNPVQVTQYQKSDKNIKNCWFYYSPSRDDEILKQFPVTKFLNRINLEEVIHLYEWPTELPSGRSIQMKTIVDLVSAKEKQKLQKEDKSIVNSYWKELLKGLDKSQYTKVVEYLKSKKTELKEGETITTDELLARIASKIQSNSSINYYENDVDCSEEESLVSDESLSDSNVSEEETEEVVKIVPVMPPPQKKNARTASEAAKESPNTIRKRTKIF